MPALEMAQETGKIISWLKKEGDAITKGEPILEVETDKAVVEVEAMADGVLAGIKSQEGDVVPVGVTIAWIVAPGEKPPADTPTTAPSARKITEQVSSQSQARLCRLVRKLRRMNPGRKFLLRLAALLKKKVSISAQSKAPGPTGRSPAKMSWPPPQALPRLLLQLDRPSAVSRVSWPSGRRRAGLKYPIFS